MIYGHGDDAFRYGDQLKLNFSDMVMTLFATAIN